FREGGFEVFARDAVLRQQRTDRAHDARGDIGGAVGIGAAHEPEKSEGEGARDRIAHPLHAAAQPPDRRLERARHQKLTITLPKTCRLSSRARPFSKSAKANSLSMIGVMPAAILERLSRKLRIVQPNEPRILYCCWKSCIRLIVTVGPAVEPQVTSRPPRLSTSSEPL